VSTEMSKQNITVIISGRGVSLSRRREIGSDGAVATSSYWPCISDLSGLLTQCLGEGEVMSTPCMLLHG